MPEPGESALQAAVREAREEAALAFEPAALVDVGLHDYLPTKRLHLFAAKVAERAFAIADCHCSSTFAHRTTGRATPEVDGYDWQPLDGLDDWCGPNLRRVLRALDWSRIEQLPELATVRTVAR
jgi:8-oxo-dGTP pyrophosphatase MutT (NUDIX family)